MEQDEFQAEHDANIEAVERMLEQVLPDEVRKIAATQTVKALYLEKDRVNHEKEVQTLRSIIALQEASTREADATRSAYLANQARQLVQQMTVLVPEMRRISLSKNNKKAVEDRLAKDPVQAAKVAAREEFFEKRRVLSKGRWFTNFAFDMLVKHKGVLESHRTLCDWCTEWNAEYEAEYEAK